MKIACLQYAPEVGKLSDNIAKANAILEEAVATGSTEGLEWLHLPELALTGYNFHSLAQISPFLEPTASGTSTNWAVEWAKRLRCHVTIGYPEKASDDGTANYNSTVTVSPAGEVLLNYRKTFLYYTDETWAQEGDKRFFAGPLGTLGPVSMGICMDINPHKFLAPWHHYEFATHALQHSSPLVALNMAWLTRLTPEELLTQPPGPDQETLAYWLERFYPLIGASKDDAVCLIMANRSGIEGGIAYAGTSTVIRIERGRTQIYDILGKTDQKLLVVDTAEAPKYAVTTGTAAG